MNLVPMGYLLKRALNQKYAVPALNIANLETVKNVLTAANELRAPVIIAVYHGDAYNCGFRTIVEIVRCLGEEAPGARSRVDADLHPESRSQPQPPGETRTR